MAYIEALNWDTTITTSKYKDSLFSNIGCYLVNHGVSNTSEMDSLMNNAKGKINLIMTFQQNYPYNVSWDVLIQNQLDSLKQYNHNDTILMSDREYNFITSAYVGIFNQDFTNKSYSEVLDLVKSAAVNKISDFQAIQWNVNEGNIAAYFIYIAKYSSDYWKNYSYDPNYPTQPNEPPDIAQWVVADAAGALIGGVAAGIDSYQKDGAVNWKSVGIWALAGAAGCSFPCTKWFKMFS